MDEQTRELFDDIEIPSIECFEAQKVADVFIILLTRQKQYYEKFMSEFQKRGVDLMTSEEELPQMVRRYLSFHDDVAEHLLKYLLVTEVECPHSKKHDRKHFFQLMTR